MFLLSDDPLFSDEELFLMCAASGGKTVQDTATGNPLVFTTDLAKPLKSLLIPFTPVQSGTGDPSPENIRSIIPWNGLSVFGGGKNLFDFDEDNIRQETTSAGTTRAVYHTGLKNGKFTASAVLKEGQTAIQYGVNIGTFQNNVATVKATFLASSGTTDRTLTVGKDEEIVLINPADSVSDLKNKLVKYNIQVEVGENATTYEAPHITDTDIVFPSPVYGGTLDVVSGVLTVEWGAVRADAFPWETSILTSKGKVFMTTGSVSVPFAPWQNEKGQAFAMSNAMVKNAFAGTFDDAPANSFWWNNGRSGYRCVFDQNASVQDLMQFFTDNDVIFCGKLAEPFEITLTPEQITALKGDNTIWSDADGQMTAVYLKKG